MLREDTEGYVWGGQKDPEKLYVDRCVWVCIEDVVDWFIIKGLVRERIVQSKYIPPIFYWGYVLLYVNDRALSLLHRTVLCGYGQVLYLCYQGCYIVLENL
jgi:hypothetical protein